ncbi:Nuclear transport factor 2 family protein with RNA binding domain putative isoform 1 [Tripterygium wilfordii]|uniref:Nuclear transport factor 2 family protein with RNA binding domain putative isoform 1 n=1 Tax=Tripterygium wilfordii TaxID=458696 RepID=A0A7J7D4K5_TRIWF|nr:nuclear transport factor 2-like [Tripterygium wilfordii]XP_038714295.1 nuclear transport factor 2-like [Tripterygium wilfordii]KAF5741287.1 Nuclear transport factor 2 family protein with RNA binding domain putative isoform 1 [Tripterygium wilfordii]
MPSSVEQAAAPTADVVGNAFVHQYYLILHQSPDLVHRFYHDISKLGRPEGDGVMSITTTMQAIDKKIRSLDCKGIRAEIITVDAQDSYNGGVLVLGTGFLTGKDNIRRKFTQSFFLAPQDKGYFVLNDVLRYVDDEQPQQQQQQQQENQDSVYAVEAPLAPSQDPSLVQENHISEHIAVSPEETNGVELYNPSENGDDTMEEEEALEPEFVDEVPDDSQVVITESNIIIEELPKKSYASILKVMKEGAPSLSSFTPAPSRSLQKNQERPIICPPPPPPVLETPISSSDCGNNHEGDDEGPSIYIKSLPFNATPALVENEFKKFGLIKSGGIQVRSQKGFCFGFVEFEDANAVQSAIEASPIMIGGRRVVVEEKRSKGVNRGRSSGAGYRNEGARGRGNHNGSRGYGRNDSFNNREEFGNRGGSRGGFSNRGEIGYQRTDSSGDRGNRSGGLTINAAVKNSAPRVSAPA